MKNTPLHIQQWVDALPASNSANQTPSRPMPIYVSPNKSPIRRPIPREVSVQSDTGSTCSSVESVLELRKPDPEEVLLGLGFGPSKNSNIVSKIPARFLQPSRLLSQIDINKFLEQYGINKYSEHSSSSPSSPRTNTC